MLELPKSSSNLPGNGIKYETITFLTLPPKDVFLASVLIGTLGAVMDVSITIASGMYEILKRSPQISMKRWALAGKTYRSGYNGNND